MDELSTFRLHSAYFGLYKVRKFSKKVWFKQRNADNIISIPQLPSYLLLSAVLDNPFYSVLQTHINHNSRLESKESCSKQVILNYFKSAWSFQRLMKRYEMTGILGHDSVLRLHWVEDNPC